MFAEGVVTLTSQIVGGVAILGATFYIVHAVARFDVDLGDRYRAEADRLRGLLAECEKKYIELAERYKKRQSEL